MYLTRPPIPPQNTSFQNLPPQKKPSPPPPPALLPASTGFHQPASCSALENALKAFIHLQSTSARTAAKMLLYTSCT